MRQKQPAVLKKAIEEQTRLSPQRLAEVLDGVALGYGGLHPPFIKKVYEKFLDVDIDGCGLLNFGEFQRIFDDDRAPEMELIERLFLHFDAYGSGEIDLKDFIVGISIFSDAALIDKMKFAFLIFDDDSSGFMERDELMDLIHSTFPDKEAEIRDNFATDIYRFLGLLPVQRVSFESYLKVVQYML